MSQPTKTGAPAPELGEAGDGPHVDIESFVHHTTLPHTRASLAIDRGIRAIGDAVSWLWLVLFGIILVNVFMRYVLGQGRIVFEELQWHIYAIGFLVGLAYVLQADEHVRVDVVHDRLSLRAQAWIELYGILLLLMPFIALVMIYSVPFALDAFVSSEHSQTASGLPYRWVIKSFLFIGFALLGVAAFSRLTRVCSLLFGAPRAVGEPVGPEARAARGNSVPPRALEKAPTTAPAKE